MKKRKKKTEWVIIQSLETVLDSLDQHLNKSNPPDLAKVKRQVRKALGYSRQLRAMHEGFTHSLWRSYNKDELIWKKDEPRGFWRVHNRSLIRKKKAIEKSARLHQFQ